MTYASVVTRVPSHSAPWLMLLLWMTARPMPSQGQTPSWPVHSMDRPRPRVVQPAPAGQLVPPPADAIVLFDGHSLDQWVSGTGKAGWKVDQGYAEVAKGTGSISTRREFGDIQLHLEWATPTPPKGHSQERGNSGVFFMGLYEVQVLDSYQNDTYPDGQAGALYGQAPPLVNACRPPGEWQTYDIVFRRPRFNADGSLLRAARATVFQNGVLVQDATPFKGRTVHGKEATYSPHGDRGPLMLQDHGDPVRYRNIWVRELAETP
jgi:3-keto-disaccharide hydrolase